MDSCGYFATNSNYEGEEIFTRRIIHEKPYPRFHLVVKEEGVDYKFDLHFDIRQHVADHFGDNIPLELKRINSRLKEIDSRILIEPGINNLKRKFVALSMYGAYENLVRGRLTYNHNFTSQDKKDARRKHRSPRLNLKFVLNNYEDY